MTLNIFVIIILCFKNCNVCKQQNVSVRYRIVTVVCQDSSTIHIVALISLCTIDFLVAKPIKPITLFLCSVLYCHLFHQVRRLSLHIRQERVRKFNKQCRSSDCVSYSNKQFQKLLQELFFPSIATNSYKHCEIHFPLVPP